MVRDVALDCCVGSVQGEQGGEVGGDDVCCVYCEEEWTQDEIEGHSCRREFTNRLSGKVPHVIFHVSSVADPKRDEVTMHDFFE